MSNKDAISNENIIIKAQNEEIIKVKDSENELLIDANQVIKDDKILVELIHDLTEKTLSRKFLDLQKIV